MEKQQGLDAFSHRRMVQGMTGVQQLTKPVSGLQKQLLVTAVWHSNWVTTKAAVWGGGGGGELSICLQGSAAGHPSQPLQRAEGC